MDKAYDHKKVEDRIYRFWEGKGYFKANPDSPKKPYGILIPPPNVNGPLHLGHAMQHAILDAIARFKRMQDFDVLLLPGVDHAGILFEGTLNKILEKEGTSKQNLGREAWMKRAWQFKDENYKAFHDTWKAMGLSADWQREVFTLDLKIQKAVFHEFKTFWDQDLLYKGAYIVQWCPKDQTAIEDLEMEYQERKEKLYFVKYLIQGTENQYITVATARPETIFADVAIAVHPTDKRYSTLVGKRAVNPLNGLILPIIKDKRVDRKFGTGALKITPGHDPLDYEIGKDNNLLIHQAVDKTGRMTDLTGELKGLKVEEARKTTTETLEKKGAIEKEEDYIHSVPVCERCKTTVEPLISEEWFVKMKPLAEKALKNMDKINFLPKNYKKILSDWMKEIHDWSISRSLWWGHRIPVWYCGLGKELARPLGFHESVVSQLFAGKTKTYRLKDHWYKVGNKIAFHQTGGRVIGLGTITNIEKTTVGKLPLNDPAHGAIYRKRDELKAALKKYNLTINVGDNTPAYVYSYKFRPVKEQVQECGEFMLSFEKPARCFRCGSRELVQDNQVLDTWFSSGLWPMATLGWPDQTKELKKYYPWDFELTAPEIKFLWIARMIMLGLWFKDEIPFKNMFFHGMLRDLLGRKFSKSLGNGIDPYELRDQWGTDATRMALYTYSIPGRDGRTSKQVMDERCKNFRNFETKIRNIYRYIYELKPKEVDKKTDFRYPDDAKIRRKLEVTIEHITKRLERFELHLAVDEIYDFIWHEFADIYIEQSKKRREEAQPCLEYVFESSLKLLHPFMPFITEEIYQKLGGEGSLMVQKWPFDSGLRLSSAERPQGKPK